MGHRFSGPVDSGCILVSEGGEGLEVMMYSCNLVGNICLTVDHEWLMQGQRIAPNVAFVSLFYGVFFV